MFSCALRHFHDGAIQFRFKQKMRKLCELRFIVNSDYPKHRNVATAEVTPPTVDFIGADPQRSGTRNPLRGSLCRQNYGSKRSAP